MTNDKEYKPEDLQFSDDCVTWKDHKGNIVQSAVEDTPTVDDTARNQALDGMPIADWHSNEWNDWIARHHDVIRTALSAPKPTEKIGE